MTNFKEFFLNRYTHNYTDTDRGTALVAHYLARHCNNEEFNYCCGDMASDPALQVSKFIGTEIFDPKKHRPMFSTSASILTCAFRGSVIRTHNYVGAREDNERVNVIHWAEVYGFFPITDEYSLSRSMHAMRTRDGKIVTSMLIAPTDVAKQLPYGTLNIPDIVGGYELTLQAKRVRISDDSASIAEVKQLIKNIEVPVGTVLYQAVDVVAR